MEIKIKLVVNGNLAAQTTAKAITLEEYTKALKRFGLTEEAAEHITLQRAQVCKNCGKNFLRVRSSQTFCSKRCKNAFAQRVHRAKKRRKHHEKRGR